MTTPDRGGAWSIFWLSMHKGQFANQQELRGYADAQDLAYVWEGTNAFSKRWRLAQLAQPGTYQLVEVRTKRGMRAKGLKKQQSAGFSRPHSSHLNV
jgi:hypothetical protein